MEEPARKRGPKPSPQKREAIVAAALEIFAQKGVDASTTRDIAERASTTERTLFKHFGSKEALTHAVIQQVSIQFARDTFFSRLSDETPFTRPEFTAWHQAMLQDRVANATASPDQYRVLFRELLRDNTFRTNYGSHWIASAYAPMTQHLASMQHRGEIARLQTPEALASAFFTLNLGYLLTRFALIPEKSWDSDRDIMSITTMFAAICGTP